MNGFNRPVVHVSGGVLGHGGIETMLRYNREQGPGQFFVSLFDRNQGEREDYRPLDITWRTPLWEMRRRFREALAPHQGKVVLYHNGWGLPLFHDLDGAERRVAVLHADPAFHRPDLPGYEGLIDAAIGCCPGFEEEWPELLPWLGPERRFMYRIPIERQPSTGEASRRAGRPLVLGYAGRIERGQKCLHLVPNLWRDLTARGIDFRFEFVGDGSLLPWLRQRADQRVHFHGWLPSRERYDQILQGWDAGVYFSDHEGGPIALLECMAAGAVPFYPRRRGSWADHYVPQIDRLCHYPPEDTGALANAIGAIFNRPVETVEALRARGRQLVSGHDHGQYQEISRQVVDWISTQPRVSEVRSRPARFLDQLPLGFATRFARDALRRS